MSCALAVFIITTLALVLFRLQISLALALTLLLNLIGILAVVVLIVLHRRNKKNGELVRSSSRIIRAGFIFAFFTAFLCLLILQLVSSDDCSYCDLDSCDSQIIHFEASLVALLAMTIFLSLFAIEKQVFIAVFCFVLVCVVWWFPANSMQDSITFKSNFTLNETNSYLSTDADQCNRLSFRLQYSFLTLLIFFMAVLQSRRVELVTRFDYIWQTQAEEEKVETENRRRLNRALLENLLPRHVADHFLKEQASSCELYHEQQENAAILFATITGFSQFYVELDANNEGVECLRLLNELIVDFDEASRKRMHFPFRTLMRP